MIKHIYRLLPLVLAGALASTTASAQGLTLRLGHIGEPGSLFASSADEFARIANEKLGDRAEIQVFGASQLGKDIELLQKLKLGQVDFALPSSVMSSVADEFGVFEMPYIIQDREHIQRVQAELGESVFNEAAKREGYHILTWFENGFRHISNNRRPINVPADLEGVKLRTPNGEWRVKMFQQYGANPTPMAFSEVFTALQTGVIDGQENPYAQIWSAKFYEVQDYLSITGHVYTPAYVVASERNFSRLPEDIRATLAEAAAEAQTRVYEMAAELENDLLTQLEERGIAINEADKQAFIDASQPIYDEFADSVDGGSELIESVRALAQP